MQTENKEGRSGIVVAVFLLIVVTIPLALFDLFIANRVYDLKAKVETVEQVEEQELAIPSVSPTPITPSPSATATPSSAIIQRLNSVPVKEISPEVTR